MAYDPKDPLTRHILGEDVNCGTCVVFNAYHGAYPDGPEGACAILGARRPDDPPCRRWFSKEQLHAPLYGRGA